MLEVQVAATYKYTIKFVHGEAATWLNEREERSHMADTCQVHQIYITLSCMIPKRLITYTSQRNRVQWLIHVCALQPIRTKQEGPHSSPTYTPPNSFILNKQVVNLSRLIKLRPSLICSLSFLEKVTENAESWYCNLHRHTLGHRLAASRCLPQVWLRSGVLDLFAADYIGIHPWDSLCCLYHPQVIINLFNFL